jgi:hypothetical protein
VDVVLPGKLFSPALGPLFKNQFMAKMGSKKTDLDSDDQITKLVGDFGKWQALLIFPLLIHFVFGSWQTLVTSFLSLEGDFWCQIEAPEGVFESLEQWRNFSSPLMVRFINVAVQSSRVCSVASE